MLLGRTTGIDYNSARLDGHISSVGPSLLVLAYFIALSSFTFVSLMPIPGFLRGALLTSCGMLLGLGAVFLCLFYAARRSVWLCLAVVFACIFWIFAFPAAINGGDDNGAYLLFATGFYQDIQATVQPLSERRLFSVGGIYAFQAPVIHWLGVRYLSVVEPAFGILLFILAVVTRRALPVSVAMLTVIIISLMPLLGSAALANTASTFVIGSLSLLLILLALGLAQRARPTWLDLVAILILPLAALVFRPTTAPFNGLLAAGMCAWVVTRNPADAARLSIVALPVAALFGGSLFLYHQIGGTWLYPLLGRGTHITAEGISIAGSMPLSQHLANVVRVAFRDVPTVIALVCTMAGLVAVRGNHRVFLAFLAVAIAFVIFAAAVVIATSGLASGRYITPVSFSMIVASLIVIGEAVESWPFLRGSRVAHVAPLALFCCLVVLLVTARIAGNNVAERRLLQYNLATEDALALRAVSNLIASAIGSEDAVMLVDIAEARFLVETLHVRILLMDQPGMVSPWRKSMSMSSHGSYAEGLRLYLEQSKVKAILVKTLSCAPQQDFAPSGWADLMRYGQGRNNAALCDIGKSARRIDLGRYTILFPGEP
ncbi:hypothetical protein [Rhizobium sp. CSW-27]|uniref:hypothetical protein n=1 Tax=Rhizobium sp. CSW-27 TaxID=2839985 RepID=UPI001C033C5F|nr:hypothetical protein [Rhizobium sp. CSW-27]MBT9372342.1 hypothetical protein [Rhizobium sp. CSW-27]